MGIRFRCERCKQKYELAETHAGRKFRCTKCETVLRVPHPEAAETGPDGLLISRAAAAAPDSAKARPRKPRKQSAESSPDNRARPPRPAATTANASGEAAAPPRQQQAGRGSRHTLILGGSAAAVVVVAVAIALAVAGSRSTPSPAEHVKPAPEPPRGPQVELVGDLPEHETPAEPEPVEPLVVVELDEPLLAEVGVPVEVALQAQGGAAPYRWAVSRVTPLPDGLALSEAGVLHGEPAWTGDHRFEVLCTDARGNRAERSVALLIDEQLEIFFVGDPPEAFLDEPYHFRLHGDGGLGPYTWELVDTVLPEGLAFDVETGSFTGVPTEARRFRATVRLTDARGRCVERALLLDVLDTMPQVSRDAPAPPPIEDLPDTDWDDIAVPEPVGEEATGWTPPDRDTLARLSQLNAQAIGLMNEGKHREALEVLQDALRLDSRAYVVLYNMACCYAQLDDVRNAVTMLRRAIESGFSNFEHIRHDPDFDSIRSHPDFANLVQNPAALQAAAANAKELALKREFPGYLTRVDHGNRFIMATNQSSAVLDMLVARIVNFANVIWRDLGWHRPDYYIEIILPSSVDFANLLRRRGFPPNVGGWYSPMERRLTNGTIGHVLTHEFLHALHFADLAHRGQNHHIWFVEGLATLYEDSRLPDSPTGTIEPMHSARMHQAKQLQQREDRWTWRQLFRMSQGEFMPNPQNSLLNYGTSRYICFWLWQQGKLKEFYNLYCETYGEGRDGRAGIVAMERLFRKPLERIEAEWREWLLGLPNPPRRNQAWLGIKYDLERDSTGMRIGEVVPGSPAQVAGLRPGDVIIEIDGRATDNRNNLVQALSAFNPGDTVPITFVRSEQDPVTGRWARRPITVPVRLVDRAGRR